MFCEKCGTQISNEAKFCRNCGAAVDPISEQNQRSDIKITTNSSSSSFAAPTTFTTIRKLQFAAVALAIFSFLLWFLPAFELDATLWGVSAQDLYDYGYVDSPENYYTEYGNPFESQSYFKLISDFSDSTTTIMMALYLLVHAVIAGLIVKEILNPSGKSKTYYIICLCLSILLLISYVCFSVYLSDLVKRISFDFGDLSLTFFAWINIAVQIALPIILFILCRAKCNDSFTKNEKTISFPSIALPDAFGFYLCAFITVILSCVLWFLPCFDLGPIHQDSCFIALLTYENRAPGYIMTVIYVLLLLTVGISLIRKIRNLSKTKHTMKEMTLTAIAFIIYAITVTITTESVPYNCLTFGAILNFISLIALFASLIFITINNTAE